MIKRKINVFIAISIIILIVIIILFFSKNNYKKLNIGNNNLNKTLDECEEYIYNISSYEALVSIEIQSNKNKNKYIVKQVCNEKEKFQELIEPKNIQGIKFIYKENTLSIENTNLNLKKVYEKYPCLEENVMFLIDFISQYRSNKDIGKAYVEKQENYAIYTINLKNIYRDKEELYIDLKTGNPTKLIVQDNNKKNIIYILYNEIKLNI